jgi:polyisoprenyl-teichoic acid--peptidoglycan teichoic acid transferase
MAVYPPPVRGGRTEATREYPSRRPPNVERRRWPRRTLIIANLVVLALIALGASAYGYVQWRLGQVHRIAVAGLKPPGQDAQSPASAAGPPITILAVGSDTRALGKGSSAIFGAAGSVTGQRSDSIMLLRVVPATSSVALLSIPRDLLVPVAGMGVTRINATFGSGANLLISTIENDLGIDINHFIVLNFYTFTQIADALGGVYQYFPTPARDLFSDLSVPHAGCVLLEGSQALAFVRSREYQYYANGSWQYQLVPESDLARIQRQQDFVKLAIKKAEQVAPTNPLALNGVIGGITNSLTVDSTFTGSLMLTLAKVLRHANAAGIPDWTYPTVNSVSVAGALDPVPSEDQAMVQQFLHYGLPAGQAPVGSSAPTTASSAAAASPAAASEAAASPAGASEAGGSEAAASPAAASPAGAGSSGARPGGAGSAAVSLALKLISATSATSATGLEASGTNSLTTTPADQVQLDSSSYYEGAYVPPGLQPGQVPPKCPS